jgi:outer membrane protein assembly factor BamA
MSAGERGRVPAAPTALVAGLALALALASAPELAAQDVPPPDPDAARADTIAPGSYRSFSPFPILMYDSDIGFGYGAKLKLVDYLGKHESFDATFFNSTKGERWYVFQFSVPDLEIRQGKRYGLSFDFKAEYDKFLNYSFYGFGAGAPESDRTIFPYETINVPVTFARGISRHVVVEASYTLRWLRFEAAPEGGTYAGDIAALAAAGRQFRPYLSLVFRYDTSDSQIHPTRGLRLILQDDLAGRGLGSGETSFNRITLDVRKYWAIFGARDVLAVRGLAQYIDGTLIPFFDFASLGGGAPVSAMRGYGLNRFLDKGKFLVNAEYRFPIVWRLGGNVFCDTGTVWPSLRAIDFGKIAFDAGVGLRFYMPDFVVRVDVAWSGEGMGLYFNFGHIF